MGFTSSIPLFEARALRLLKAFLLVLSNLTDFQYINQNFCMDSLYSIEGQSYFDQVFFVIVGWTSNPSLVFININIFLLFLIKNGAMIHKIMK